MKARRLGKLALVQDSRLRSSHVGRVIVSTSSKHHAAAGTATPWPPPPSHHKFLLALPVVTDAGLEVLDVQVGGLHRQVVEPLQPAAFIVGSAPASAVSSLLPLLPRSMPSSLLVHQS